MAYFNYRFSLSLFLLFLGQLGIAYSKSFTPCSDQTEHPELAGSQCTKVLVPLDYQNASLGKAEIFVRKIEAKSPKGSIWFLAGGPGESGASYYPKLLELQKTFPHYNLLFPDHRGTGYSTRLCPNQEKKESPGGFQLAGKEWPDCFQYANENQKRTQSFSISNAARDLDLLVKTLSHDTPNYLFGVSYGTQLILRFLQISDVVIQGIVLDSLVPVETSDTFDLSRRSHVTHLAGKTYLASCFLDRHCSQKLGFSSLESLRDHLNKELSIEAYIPGNSLKQMMGFMLDHRELRQMIPDLIESSRKVHQTQPDIVKSILRRSQDIMKPYQAFEQFSYSIPLGTIMSNSENNQRPSIDSIVLKKEDTQHIFTSSLGYQLLTQGFPLYKKDQYFGESPKTKSPILVLHGSLDPKTPYLGALEHINKLQKNGISVGLVTVPRGVHALVSQSDSCVLAKVKEFYQTLKPINTICPYLP